jgi:hypothetical protein
MYYLTVEKADVLCILHHFLGPAVLVWIRSSLSACSPADALISRPLASFLLFGVVVGGSSTTGLILVLKLFKGLSRTETICWAASALTWALTAGTIGSCLYMVLYIQTWECELYNYLRWGSLSLLGLLAFEYWLQWRWAFKFLDIVDGVWATQLGTTRDDKSALDMAATMKYLVLQTVLVSFCVIYGDLFLRAGKSLLAEHYEMPFPKICN